MFSLSILAISLLQIEQEFLVEAPEAWAKVRSVRGLVQCEASGDWFQGETVDAPKVSFATEVLRHDGSMLVRVRRDDPARSTPLLVYCNGERYSFAIREAPTGGGYVLMSVDTRWENADQESARAAIEAAELARNNGTSVSADVQYSRTFDVTSQHLGEILLGPAALNRVIPFECVPWGERGQVQISDAVEKRVDGERLITITARGRLSDSQPLPSPTGQIITNVPSEQFESTITFSASRFWVPVSATTKYDNGASEEFTAEYADEQDGVPLLTRLARTGRPAEGTGYRIVTQYAYPTQEPTPAEFALPFYGLPEPPEFRGNTKAWYAVIFGILLVIGGVIVRRRGVKP